MIVPDGIEPVVGWRRWGVRNGRLVSMHSGHLWEHGEAMQAKCQHVWHKFALTRDGYITWKETKKVAEMYKVPRPLVRPPKGMGYELIPQSHDAPEAACSCGLYARDTEQATRSDGLGYGVVLGKVSLWGKVIPGDRGYRAQFGYPAEIWAEEPFSMGLDAYGVPVHVYDGNDKEKAVRRMSAQAAANQWASGMSAGSARYEQALAGLPMPLGMTNAVPRRKRWWQR